MLAKARRTYPSVGSFLNAIKKIGVNNASVAEQICLRPSVLRSMMAIYQERFAHGNDIYATYDWVCITGRPRSSVHNSCVEFLP